MGEEALRRRPRGQPHVAIERVAATNDVEHDRVELGEIVALEDVGDVLERDRLPDVHAHENIAAANALLCGGAASANVQDRQSAAVARAAILEFVLVHHRQLQPQRAPRAIGERRFRRRARKGRHCQLARLLLPVAKDLNLDILARLGAQ